MSKKNPYEKVKQIRCVACDKPVMVDQFGHGDCPHCGWYQSSYDLNNPDRVSDPNMVSLTKARQLIAEGRPLKPSYDDFIAAWHSYGEMQFTYRGRYFGMLVDQDEKINFYEKNIVGSIQTFNTIEEFIENAHIDGALLKDIWDGVENADYM